MPSNEVTAVKANIYGRDEFGLKIEGNPSLQDRVRLESANLAAIYGTKPIIWN